MRRFILKLRNDCKGAVTVFVTLILLPALLITGIGVDVARIYSANSIVHDANQMAANSALASYDALLQDLYGLFGIMIEDENFASSLDDYIKYSIYPKDSRSGVFSVGGGPQNEVGALHLFYGSDPKSITFTPKSGQDLSNPDVLRRQIEEYSKFRAPVIIVQDLISRIETFQKIQADADVIKDKMDIEDDGRVFIYSSDIPND